MSSTHMLRVLAVTVTIPVLVAAHTVVRETDSERASDEARPPEAGLALWGVAQRRVEARANVHTGSTQEAAAMDRDAAGRAVVAWQSKRQESDGSFGIYARRFDAAGRAIGDEVHVNLHAEGGQVQPAAALAPSGAAWIAWESYGQDGDRGGVFLRRFDAELERGTNEILVDTERDGNQDSPAIAVDAAGRALVAWTSTVDGARVVRARLFAPDGTPAAGPVTLSSTGEARDWLPRAVADPIGGFVAAWARTSTGGDPEAILVRTLDAEGAPSGDEVVVAKGACIEPALAVNAGGDLLVAWLELTAGDYALRLREVSRDGPAGPDGEAWALGEVHAIDTGTPGHVSGSEVALRDDGSALVAWTRFGDDGKKGGLFALELDAALAPAGAAFRLSASSAGHQKLGVGGARSMHLAQDGTLACAWSGAGPEGDSSGVNLTLLAPASLEADALLARRAPLDPVELQEEGALPHEPPVFTDETRDRSFFLDQESLGGPDYGFVGIAARGLNPPDPHIAAGPEHVVTIVNGRMEFFDKRGNMTFSVPTDGGSGFWAPVGSTGFSFDPEVLYDPHSDRFMAMICERDNGSFFLFAVSDDSDPNGTWHKYRFDVTGPAQGTDIDSPNMAVDDQAVYLSADFFGPDRYLVHMVEKAPLLVGGANPIENSLLISGGQSMGLPVTYDAGAPAQYVIEAFESFSNTQVRLHAITDPLGAPVRQTIDVTVPTYEQPENPPQKGTSSRPETFESRFWSCMYRDGSLWATHHQGSGEVHQRWYEFDMNGWPSGGTPTLVQSGDIAPGEGVRTYFGSIWADAAGNAGIVYALSGANDFISMGRAFREPGDPLGTMKGFRIMQASTEPEISGRWGDYSNCVADPDAVGAFWGLHEYRTGGARATWVGLFGPCATPVPYCTAKTTSTGSVPSIGWTGQPSVGVNDFNITLANALPNKNGIMFWGTTPGAVPFMGGTKCVLAPTVRTPIFSFDGSGATSQFVPTTIDDLGQTRYYQFWFRDPQHPDGTTVGLSNAIQFTFCP